MEKTKWVSIKSKSISQFKTTICACADKGHCRPACEIAIDLRKRNKPLVCKALSFIFVPHAYWNVQEDSTHEWNSSLDWSQRWHLGASIKYLSMIKGLWFWGHCRHTLTMNWLIMNAAEFELILHFLLHVFFFCILYFNFYFGMVRNTNKQSLGMRGWALVSKYNHIIMFGRIDWHMLTYAMTLHENLNLGFIRIIIVLQTTSISSDYR